jgi:hypothetical protein
MAAGVMIKPIDAGLRFPQPDRGQFLQQPRIIGQRPPFCESPCERERQRPYRVVRADGPLVLFPPVRADFMRLRVTGAKGTRTP